MKAKLLLFPIVLMGLSSCGTVERMTCLINQSTNSIHANRMTVERSTDVIHQNTQEIRESTKAIEENHKKLEAASAS